MRDDKSFISRPWLARVYPYICCARACVGLPKGVIKRVLLINLMVSENSLAGLTFSATTLGAQAGRILKRGRAIARIHVEIQSSLHSCRVFADKAPHGWTVVARRVII